jgi:UDP-N-acetyl-2-amino-2-deoxyglucuronate dehydrogenase
VLNPWNADALHGLEEETGKRVYNILQFRHHPSIIALKNKFDALPKEEETRCYITYITRGKWYHYSWKGNINKSGGILLTLNTFLRYAYLVFGLSRSSTLHYYKPDKAGGLLELENARVKWFLSLDRNDLPASNGTYRSITIDGEEMEFSEGFTDLHTISYREILAGRGFCIAEARPSIEVVYEIRNSQPVGMKGEYHPVLKKLKWFLHLAP